MAKSLVKSPEDKKKNIGWLGEFMSRIKQKKKPLNLKSIKKSKLKNRPSTEGDLISPIT